MTLRVAQVGADGLACWNQPVFGLLTPCRHTMPDDLFTQWQAHLCGLCLSLRDGHGHPSRLTTNTDAAMVSILVAAQRNTTLSTTRAGRCPLRGMKSAEVVAVGDPGLRLATGVSLTLAAGKAADIVEEQRSGLAPPSRVRWTMASSFSCVVQPIFTRSGRGMPPMVE